MPKPGEGTIAFLARVVSHNRPRLEELREPRVLWEGGQLHARLRRGGYTMLSSRHGRKLLALARDIERRGIPGALVDCGARNGGSTALMSTGAPSREVWAFDSFEGLPAPEDRDTYTPRGEGELVGSPAMVRACFPDRGNGSRLHIVEGWFEDTFPRAVDEVGPVALLHVDADLYQSVRLALETFYPRVSEGGYVVIDDYVSWPGAKQAADEFRREREVSSPMVSDHYWQKR